MRFCACTGDNPLAKARGLSSCTGIVEIETEIKHAYRA